MSLIFGPFLSSINIYSCKFPSRRYFSCISRILLCDIFIIMQFKTFSHFSCDFFFFFFKDFIFFLFLLKAPRYIAVYSLLWVLLVVACGTLPQRGLMRSIMSAPRIRTNETLGRLQRSART